MLYLGAFRPEVLIRRMPSRGLNSFSQLARGFRWASIPSCNLREPFDGPQFLPATCESLSRGLNSFLHLAGAFRWVSIPSCNLREAFRPLRFLLASCESLSTAIDISVISNHRHTELDFYSKTAKQSEAKQNGRQAICLPDSYVF